MHDINLAARFATHILLVGEQQYWFGSVDAVLPPELLQAAFDCSFNVVASVRDNWFAPAG